MAIKMNGEAPFPQAGEGVFICFPASAIAKLEETHGVGEYFEKIEIALNNASGKVMIECLQLGLYRHGEEGKRVKVAFDPDETLFPIAESVEPIMDALSLASSGKTYSELVEEAVRRQAEMESRLNELEGTGVAEGGDDNPSEG